MNIKKISRFLLADFKTIKSDSDHLIKILSNISSELEEHEANDYIDYASGGALAALDQYDDSSDKEKQSYENLIKKAIPESNRLSSQLIVIKKNPKFESDPYDFIFNLLKTQYKNIWALAKMGE